MDRDAAALEGQQTLFAQKAQHAVDVNRAQPQRVCQKILRQRAIIAGGAAQPDKPQPDAQFQQKMGRAFNRAAPPHTDQPWAAEGTSPAGTMPVSCPAAAVGRDPLPMPL